MSEIMIFVKLDRLSCLTKRTLVNIALIHLYSQFLLVQGEIKAVSALTLQQPIVFTLHLGDGN